MRVYMLVATEDAKRLATLVRSEFKKEDYFILPNESACFVCFDGRTLELAKHLDLDAKVKKDNRPCPAVITSVDSYGGYAPSDLWDWLQEKSRELNRG